MKPLPQNPPLNALTKGTAAVSVGLLGAFSVTLANDLSLAITNKKNRAMLAILALSPGAQTTRERICGLLWGDRGEEQARGSLRQSLAVLRKELGEAETLVLQTRDDIVGLRLATVRVDAADFLKLAGTNDLASLQQAAMIYRGDLLADTSIRDPGFDEWLSAERRRLAEKAIEVLEKLSSLETGPARVEAARRLVDLDPLREASHRALMHAHTEAGETALALQQYEACRSILKSEFGVDPTTETQALRAAISIGKSDPPEPAATATSTASGLSPIIPDEKPSIVVLPFTNLSGRPDQDYVCDGVTANIIGGLGQYHDLFVIDRISSFSYKGKPVLPQDAAQQLAVRFVLNGSVQISGGRIRISVELLEGSSARQLWTNRYDRETNDLFAVQDEVTETIVATLMAGYGGRLRKAWTTRLRPAGFERLEAMDYLQRGLDDWDFTKKGTALVRELFAKAIERDPGFAKPHAKMAFSHMVDASYGFSDDYAASMRTARDLALKAIAADDADSWAHWSLAVHHMLSLRHDQALEEFGKALNNNPNDAEVMTDYGLCLSYAGRAEEGIEVALKAMRLNPFYYDWYTAQLGQLYFDAHRYDKAISTFANLRSMDSALMRVYQAASFANLGRMDDARASVNRALELDPEASLEKWGSPRLAPYAKASDLEHFRTALREAGLRERAADAAAIQEAKPSIAVLSFVNMSGDPEQDYFSDGITGDIITELSKFKEFLVIARNSSFQFRGKANDVTEVAMRLGVQYVVEGSVRKIGNRVRVTVQLIDASSTAQIWGEHYDREIDDIFAIQDEITQMIAARLARQARTAIASRARARPTDNMSAYEFYLRALQLAATYDHDTVREAEPFLRQAVKLDPLFAAAHAMLGFVEAIKHFWVYNHPDYLHAGLEMAKTALQLDPDEAYGHLATGFALLYLRRFRQAEISLDRAVALNPNDPFILSIRALLLSYTARPDEALVEINEAQRRDPFAVGWYEDFLGIILTTAGRYREAAVCYQKMATVQSWSLVRLIVCHAELGEIKEAQEALAKLKANWPGLHIDDIIETEVDFFEDPAVCSRYRAILQRVDKEE